MILLNHRFDRQVSNIFLYRYIISMLENQRLCPPLYQLIFGGIPDRIPSRLAMNP